MAQGTIAIVHYADPGFMPHVVRQSRALGESGYYVWAIGLKDRQQKSQGARLHYRTDVFSRPVGTRRGPGAFLYFFIRVFFALWKDRPAILQPIDAPALIPCYIHSVLRGIPLYYVSLEDLPHCPFFNGRPLARALWTTAENWCIRRAIHVAVVARIDADSLAQRCRIPRPYVIRNVPDLKSPAKRDDLLLRRHFGWTDRHTVLMYHGVIQKGRGVELAFPLLRRRKELRFAIGGYGDYVEPLRTMAREQGIEEQIGWIGPYAHDKLNLWAQDADIGVILFENVSKGNYQALPCKLFEYVHACVPLVASDFPEMKSYIEGTGVGVTVDTSMPEQIEAGLIKMIDDEAFRRKCANACARERERTNWQNESREYLAFLDISPQSGP